MVRWVVVMNKFTLKCILSVKIPISPFFGGCNLFFSYFRILVIQEIDFRDFGNSGNQILDIGFRIFDIRDNEFEILAIREIKFWILVSGF